MWGFPASDRSCCKGLPASDLRMRGGLAAAWAEEKLRRLSGGWAMLLLCFSTILTGAGDGGAGLYYATIGSTVGEAKTAARSGPEQRRRTFRL